MNCRAPHHAPEPGAAEPAPGNDRVGLRRDCRGGDRVPDTIEIERPPIPETTDSSRRRAPGGGVPHHLKGCPLSPPRSLSSSVIAS